MPYRIDRTVPREATAVRAESFSPVFKMKKTREEFKLARKLLEKNMLTWNEEDEEDGPTSEDALRYGQKMMEDLTDVTEPRVLDGIEEAEDIESGGTREQIEGISTFVTDNSMIEEDDYEAVEDDDRDRRRSNPPAYAVSHPWHIVDYHLYLCSAERGQTLEARRDGMYLFDGADCRRLPYNEFAEDRALIYQCFPGDQLQLLFGILPIADRRNFADRNPSFGGKHYVLGFDYDCKTLDIWCVWDNGSNIYTVTVPDLIHIMDMSLGKGGMHVGMGILSSSQYCLALESDDDPGLEIIIATLWCQWLLDFSDILFKQNTGSLPDFQAKLGSYVEQGRLILQRASYRAWFAVRDGYSKGQYKCKTINQYTNDLYTFEKSEQDGSLKGQIWVAPGLETCNQIRYDERMQRKKRVEQRLEGLFVVPETEDVQNQESVLQEILAKSDPGIIDPSATANPAEFPRTPSPKSQQGTPALSERCFSPGSPEIITPATELCDDLEVAAYQHIPLPMLLERALDLVHTHPELDTFANRGQFGSLLGDMGIGIQQPTLEFDSCRWKLEVHLEQASSSSSLLPSPALDS
ncbi:hypothetical protein BDW62DRAFT_213624 [Aspergillus aurantiobrunneus]